MTSPVASSSVVFDPGVPSTHNVADGNGFNIGFANDHIVYSLYLCRHACSVPREIASVSLELTPEIRVAWHS